MAIHKGWKVLSPGRWSCFIAQKRGGLIYQIGKWTRPERRFGPLAVFATSEEAADWIAQMWGHTWAAHLTVHACEYKPSRLRHLWRWLNGEELSLDPRSAPQGTRYARAVRTLD